MPKTQPNARTIDGKEFVRDIRSGMTDLEMSEKYGLTVYDFDRVLEYLVDVGLITKGEQLERQHLSDSQIIRAFVESCEDIKILQQHTPRFPRPRAVTIPEKRQAKEVRRGEHSRRIDPVKPRDSVL